MAQWGPNHRHFRFLCTRGICGKRLAFTFISVVVAQLVIVSIIAFRRFEVIRHMPEHGDYWHTTTSAFAISKKAAYCQEFQQIHVIFSTGCSLYQYWQAYVFFYHAMRVGQPGNITRIVSGCSAEEQRVLAQRHENEIAQKMSRRFHIHFTPDYSNYTSENEEPFMYLNKPFGVRHWMEQVFGYPDPNQAQIHDNTIIALLDPDMVLTKPLVNNFHGFPISNWYNKETSRGSQGEICVSHGYPIAQDYRYGNHWLVSVAGHLADIVGNHSPVHNISKMDAEYGYSPGPPYVITARDLYKVVVPWCEFTLRYLRFCPNINLLEMFGYSMAIAHLQLEHRLDLQMMISFPLHDREGWRFLDGVPPEEACGLDEQAPQNLPLVIHYCQEFKLGMYIVSKYDVEGNFISCEAPILLQHPRDLAVRYREWNRTNKTAFVVYKDMNQTMRVSFMFCAFTNALNQAALYFKKHHCGENANVSETFVILPSNLTR